MAEAVNGTRMPNSQTIPDPTRRALLSAIPAVAIGAAALAPAPRALAASHADDGDAALLALEPKLRVLVERGRAIWERWGEAEVKSVGLPQIEAEMEAALHAENEVLDEINNWRATTLDGLKMKARLAQENDNLTESLLDDILAL